MSAILIDSHGDVWGSKSRAVREIYDSPYSGDEFSTYAVNNLGFVYIYQFGASCHLQLRPDFVTDRALAACAEWIHTCACRRYVFALHDSTRLDLFTSKTDLLARIEVTIAGARRSTNRDFIVQAQPLVASSPSADLCQALRECPFDLANDRERKQLCGLISSVFGNRFIFAKVDDSMSKVVFEDIGQELFSPFEDWRRSAIGAPIQQLPDPAYGQWALQTYSEILRSQTPASDKVDAIVRWPGIGRARLRYNRTIVPFNDSSGTPMLISGSVADPTVDLRVGT